MCFILILNLVVSYFCVYFRECDSISKFCRLEFQFKVTDSIGFCGPICVVAKINECEPVPCIHGSCTDDYNSYICVCESGYTGTICDQGTNNFYLFLIVCLFFNSCNWQ